MGLGWDGLGWNNGLGWGLEGLPCASSLLSGPATLPVFPFPGDER